MILNYAKCNWPLLQKHLENCKLPSIPILWDQNEINKESELLEKTIHEALESHCPKTIAHKKIKISWWTSELNNMKHKVRVARRIAQNTQLSEHIEEFQKTQREYKSLI
jgi:hypothetical protein